MNKNKVIKLIAAAIFLGMSSFGVSAEPHFCAAHCASHTDPDAKMCMTHCTTGMAEGHNCATHCATQNTNDQDQSCARHCAVEK